MRLRVAAVCAGLVAWGGPLGAQSIFNSAGIGLPVEALDARTRALGSLGIGLQGPAILLTDPAAAARIFLPTGLLVAQPTWVDLTEPGVAGHTYFRGTRFPLLALAYPAFGGTVTVQLASLFDQSFSAAATTDVDVDGTLATVTDEFEQDGSVSTLNAGFARMLDDRTAVGLTISRYSGSVDRTLTRDYGDSTSLGSIEPYVSSGSWRYSGLSVTAGGSTELVDAVRVAGSATWSTDLDANAAGSTAGGDASFSVPLQLRLGASAALTDGLTLSASAVRADWTVARDDVSASTRVRTVYGVGVGVELSQARLLGREAPLRVGFRRSGLPFSVGGGDGTEQVFSGGLALVLNEANGVVFATSDLALERGSRTGGAVTEDFWRATVSVRLAGF